MAMDQGVKLRTLPVDADLSTFQYCCIKELAGEATLADTQGEPGLGILYNKPDADGRAGSIALLNGSGVLKVKLGATLSQDDPVSPEVTTARMGAAATGDVIWGWLNEGGVDGDIVAMRPSADRVLVPA